MRFASSLNATRVALVHPQLLRDLLGSPMAFVSTPHIAPILMLIVSNVFMTFAWYGHLTFKSASLVMVIAISWLIALPEYMLAVPANRIGHQVYSAAELKTIQEVITLSIFAIFSVTYLKEPLGWNHAVGFALIAAGAFFVFQGK
jgi:uncharacterized protein (DUF486 family)